MTDKIYHRKLSLKSLSVYLLLVIPFYFLPVWTNLDERYNDYWRAQIAERLEPDQRIIMVEVDDHSLNVMEPIAGRWPWPRSVHAQIVEALLSAKPKAIIFDIMFAERDVYRPDDDQYFIDTIRDNPDIYLSAALIASGVSSSAVSSYSLPESLVAERSSNSTWTNLLLPSLVMPTTNPIGLINFLADEDGVSRRYPAQTVRNDNTFNSLPLVVVNGIKESKSDTETLFNLKYKGIQAIPYSSIAYADLWQLILQGDLSLFEDKVILIGATATGLHDLRESPFAKSIPATTILATAIDNLWNDEALYWWPWYLNLSLILAGFAVIYGIRHGTANYRTQVVMVVSYCILLSISLFLLSMVLSYQDYLIPAPRILILSSVVALAVLIHQGILEYLSKQHAEETFARFLDPGVVNELMTKSDWQQSLSHSTETVSVLFSDIRGFTTLSETRTASEIMTLLNDYFNLQVEAIFNEKGTLDKFIGDAVMAFWGAPVSSEDHAIRAVRCAMQMIKNLEEFQQTLPAAFQDFDIGIGIHSGEAVVGMLGSDRRVDYTAIGDTVNLASRIEGATKGVATLLVSESTMLLCGDEYQFEYRGEFSVKGREEVVKLYRPINKGD